MKKYLHILIGCLALACLSTTAVRAQQIKIVYGKVLNKPEGKNKAEPFPSNEKVYIFAFNTVAAARDAKKELESGNATILSDASVVAGQDGYYEIRVAENGALIFRVAMKTELREVNYNSEINMNIDGGIQARRACQILEHAGYDVTPPHIVDAADFGVPQKRMRTIIMGSRIGHIDFPAPVEHHISMGSALVAPILDGDSHSPRNHKAASIDRYMKLNFGQRDKLGRVDRLDPLLPSKTVIAGGTGGGGRSHLHPFIPRTLTVRECARIQTFPDTYRFTGPMSRRFTQVGNAVPPVMAYEMACAIIRSVYQ